MEVTTYSAYDSVPRDFTLRSALRNETFNTNQTEYRIFVGHFGKNINATMKETLKKELWDNSDTVLGLGLKTSTVVKLRWAMNIQGVTACH